MLFGATITDANVERFLADYPTGKKGKPNDGSQFFICKEHGFDVLFSGGRMPSDRVLSGLFLFADRVDGHDAFSGELPFGFRLMQSHQELAAIRTPDTTWVLGEGRVSPNHPAPDSATWITPTFNLFASYSNDEIRVRHFQIVPHKPLDLETEWKPAPSWKTLALAGQLAASIKLYRLEFSVGVGEAKSAIEAFIASNNRN